VSICDVLYVVPFRDWGGILERLRVLTSPGGLLIIKTVFKKPNWKHWLGSLQEELAVNAIRITRSTGREFVYLSPEEWKDVLPKFGWEVETCTDLSGLYHNHGLLICRRKD
jgi:hypothetical protein